MNVFVFPKVFYVERLKKKGAQMRNFVLAYRFRNEEAHELFTRFLVEKFPEYRFEDNDFFTYFGCMARHTAEVDGFVNEFITKVPLSEGDYVAQYYIREEAPDDINQMMLFGPSRYIENDLQKVSRNAHDLTIEDLITFDYKKLRVQMKS
jgi:hypothetical protein